MTLRFSDDGPAFPAKLMEALFAGDVVFLCGAGISAPQLPDFEGLVRNCFAELSLDMEIAEQVSFDEGRFEEALGTLSRRLVDPDALADVVCRGLQVPPNADLAHHRTILRLSRDLENRPVVVTTNFDTLLERAIAEASVGPEVRGLSHAGQDLPQPGGTRFGGIVHLHGRVDDVGLNLERTRLVVTSAEYGDAYMRTGWASRFLFDLARVKTLVLVGYRAGDAPVRYFLNVLEADRERFRDLKPVYALDTYVDGGSEPNPRWTAIAVEPLPYRTHAALWRDLNRLADLVECPRATGRAWATKALREDVANVAPIDLEHVLWLFGADGNDALWDIPAQTITDPAWFAILHDGGVLKADRAWVLAAWVAKDFTDRRRFDFAVRWCSRFGQPLREEIRRRIILPGQLSGLWAKAWRLLVSSDVERGVAVLDGTYVVTQALSGSVLHEDLERAIWLLTPFLEFSDRSLRSVRKETPECVADLCSLRWRVRDRNGAWELVDALHEVNRVEAVAALATQALRATLETSRDAGLLNDELDANDFDVPSVEHHTQNTFHDGLVFLVVLLSGLLSRFANDPVSLRRHAEAWRALPGRLGRRLWLHALRSEPFSADEAIYALVTLPLRDFWSGAREVPLVMQERAAGALPKTLAALEKRVLDEASTYYETFDRGSGDIDWRDLARDRAIRLRLEMLRQAGVLSEVGAAALIDIEERNEHLRHKPQDRDFFGSYMSPVQWVGGDASEIAIALPEDRIRVAKTTTSSPFQGSMEGWGVYCRTDPSGALEALASAPLTSENSSLWRDLLTTVAFLPHSEAELGAQLTLAVFQIIAKAEGDFLQAVVKPLVDVYFVHPRTLSYLEGWWHRLFRCAIAAERREEPTQERVHTWMFMPSGRLAQAALIDIDRRRIAGDAIQPSDLDRLVTIASTVEGSFPSLAALANDAAFLLSVDGEQASARLAAALAADDEDGRDLRAVLVINAKMTPALAKAFAAQILGGIAEYSGQQDDAYGVALKFLVPALEVIAGDDSWPIGLRDAARALDAGSGTIREAAARILADRLAQAENKAALWTAVIAPLLAQIWPRDRRHKERGLTMQIVRMVVQTGDAFPDALKQMTPYLTASSRGLSPIGSSDVPERWPSETLTLLWLLRHPSLEASYHELVGLLDRIRASKPALEIDRRYQWLDQRAPRFV